MADAITSLARASFEHYTRTGHRLPIPADTPADLREQRAACFVSLHLGGNLRGCIGTLEPVYDCLAEEIIENAISACSRDPRFPAVIEAELPEIHCSVDVLSSPEEIEGPDQLDVKRYGVIVSKGFRRGVLLPDLDGVDTVDEQIRIAKAKAGINDYEDVQLQRFEVVRHEE